MKTFVIAEVGSNHEGKFQKATELIDIAKWAGADAVKFQFWGSAERLAERRNAAEYLPIYRKYQMPEEWLSRLERFATALSIDFMCTVYLREDIEKIVPYVRRFKIASFELTDLNFIRAHMGYQKEILISTGMSQAGSIDSEIGGFKFLHCVSAYPCPDDQANIACVKYFKGYSDHTLNPLSGAVAVACRAEYIETHFRSCETTEQSPDYAVSKNPAQLKDYISNIRQAEILLGDGVKKPQPAEAEMMKYRVNNGATEPHRAQTV